MACVRIRHHFKMNNPNYIRIILGVLAVAVSVLSGCRQRQPEVRSLLSFPETWEAAKNSDRLFCDYARKVAGETDPVREKLLSQFLTSNTVNDAVLLLEYANPINLCEYRMIGTSINPQYPTFRRLCDILLLAKGDDGEVPEFSIRQAEVQAIELGRRICSEDSRLF